MSQVYDAIHQELQSGGSVYIVCPLVNESEAEGFSGVKAAEEEYKRLRQHGVFGEHQCALVHGKMTSEQKLATLKGFAR